MKSVELTAARSVAHDNTPHMISMIIWGSAWVFSLVALLWCFLGQNPTKEVALSGLPAVVLIVVATVVAGVYIFREWDKRFCLPTGWIALSLFTGLVLSSAGLAVRNLSVASVGLAVCFATWLICHHRKSPAASRSTLQAYALVSLAIVFVPQAWSTAIWTMVEFWVGQATHSVLNLMVVPHQFVGTTFLFESGSVDVSTLGLDIVFRALLLTTLLWIGKFERAVLAIPAYVLAVLLWTMLVGVLQLIYMSQSTNTLPNEWRSMVSMVLGLILACGLLVSTDRLLRLVCYEVPLDTQVRLNNPVNCWWNQAFRRMTNPTNAKLSPTTSENQ